MNVPLYLLLISYALVPPLCLFYTQKLIYRDKNKYGPYLHFIFKYLITLSYLPLLLLPELELGIVPQSLVSLLFLLTTFLLAVLGLKPAIRNGNLFFYINGVTAAFMEEVLYRGIIFALLLQLTDNTWITLVISSLLFGIWHLKNYYWVGKHDIVIQFLYTAFVYGPIFGLMRIFTGDIYLAVLFHYITDATCALAPDWTRGWLVRGGRGRNYDDNYIFKV